MSRYEVGLQKPDDKYCYKHFAYVDSLKEAKEKAQKKAEKEKRSCIIFDNYLHQIVHREIVGEEEKPPVIEERKSTRRKKKSDKDSYFE